MPDAPDDHELLGLLYDYEATVRLDERYGAWVPLQEDRAALLAYIKRAYVRRDRLHDDGPWEPGDGSPYAAALEAEDA